MAVFSFEDLFLDNNMINSIM